MEKMKINMNIDDLVIVCCPNYPDYQEQPSDQSEAELIDCPLCENKMWLSKIKKELLLSNMLLNKDIFSSCYECFKNFSENNKSLFKKIFI